jgi:carbonic anhydrase
LNATGKGKALSGKIRARFPRIHPAVDQASPNLEAATAASARIQMNLLSQASTVVSSLVKQGKP